MPMNLADLMGGSAGPPPGPGGGAPESPPVQGSMPAPGGGAGGQMMGQIKNLMQTMPADGIKGLAKSVVSIIIKVLEGLLMAYGTDSQEGKTILGCIKRLSGISKGQQTGNPQSIIQSLIASLPPNMQNIEPGSISRVIQELMGKAGGGGGPAPAAPQPMPRPMPGGGGPGLSQIM